jgi:hypothetical protein
MGVDGTGLVWSPRSNVRLYGDTAQVTTAARLGVQIALGTDWLPSGSMNLLRELRCADDLNRVYFDKFFSDEQLWMMVTSSAAAVTATDDAIGILKAGLTADLAIYDARLRTDHRAVIAAEPQDVVLVMRGGKVMYGDERLITALGSPTCEAIDVCGNMKKVCLTDLPGTTLASIKTAAGAAAYPLFFCGMDPTDEPSCKPKRPASVMSSTIYTGDTGGNDSDGDGIPDATDNCPRIFNPIRPVDTGMQGDSDADGAGDACDVCPLEAGATNCAAVDPNDTDMDGVGNALDNCPTIKNMDQSDGDMDGKGDACDACPAAANPGSNGCPATIYEIKKGMVMMGATVSVKNALVTARSTQNYFVQIVPGDNGYVDEKYSGLYVHAPGNTVAAGHRLDINSATVSSYNGQIQLISPITANLSTGQPAPTPITETSANLAAGTRAQELEGVLVRVADATVSDTAPTPGMGDTQPTNEFVIDGVLRVNDLFYAISYPMAVDPPFPVKGEKYTSITGVLDFRNMQYKIEPRDASDYSPTPPVPPQPVLFSFGPPSFVRVNTTGTIPLPIQVALSRNATANTTVNLSTMSLALTVPASVQINMNTRTADVQVIGGATPTSGFENITASSGGVTVVGQVRVIGTNEQPKLSTLAPASTVIASGGTATFTIGLDLPAPPGGTPVTVTTMSGTINPVSPVTVAADQLTASFVYTPGASLTDTITATLTPDMRVATVTIRQRGLIINEVDYDQVGTDSNEYIELYNASAAPYDMDGLALVLVNGSNSTEYRRIMLQGQLPVDGYLVVASSTVTVPATAARINFSAAADNVQNGSPDAILILNTATGEIVDALSYEGSITAAILTGVTGTRNLVEGTVLPNAVQDNNTSVAALIRNPNGNDTDNAATDWTLTTTLTPGAANVKTP